MPGNQNVKTELRLMLSIKSYWQNTAAVYIPEFREMSYRAAHRFFFTAIFLFRTFCFRSTFRMLDGL